MRIDSIDGRAKKAKTGKTEITIGQAMSSRINQVAAEILNTLQNQMIAIRVCRSNMLRSSDEERRVNEN